MAFGTYKKGSRAENELAGKMLAQGFSVIRAAGSGGGTPCPDVLAFKGIEQYGFECKHVSAENLQLRREQVIYLKKWQENTNITTYVSWRIRGGEWLFVRLEHLKENPKSFSISLKDARKFSLPFEQILGK
ncbi:hypothetical protein COU37_00170 [Candidatus Micrarchaeota archaeon CG10_big_fil_rev_8_21_14_0_10_45_29]|nr:MAG: hypothetical protein COU37_00170 [Candidatus Micrarchaeota archaeon CG10_big_fil_rev_8_21_14_0_10_45_29]